MLIFLTLMTSKILYIQYNKQKYFTNIIMFINFIKLLTGFDNFNALFLKRLILTNFLARLNLSNIIIKLQKKNTITSIFIILRENNILK